MLEIEPSRVALGWIFVVVVVISPAYYWLKREREMFFHRTSGRFWVKEL